MTKISIRGGESAKTRTLHTRIIDLPLHVAAFISEVNTPHYRHRWPTE